MIKNERGEPWGSVLSVTSRDATSWTASHAKSLMTLTYGPRKNKQNREWRYQKKIKESI